MRKVRMILLAAMLALAGTMATANDGSTAVTSMDGGGWIERN